MKKILYIKHADSSFILSDQRVLEKNYKLIPYLMNKDKKGINFFLGMIQLCGFILIHAPGTSAMISWFGDYHSAIMSFFGKLLGIKTIIFAGGQEAICYPELRKGVYYKKWRGKIVKYALRNATHIIPNHASLIWHENFYYDPKGKKDGIKYYIPDLKTPMTVIPNGISTTRFFRDNTILKMQNRVLTVGTMSSNADFINKGFDLFTELARLNPDLDCVLIGIRKAFLPWIEEKYKITEVKNLSLIFSFCPDEILFKQYNEAHVFVQASITEGMPNTLSEAMLCECVPVGSNVNGIPDAIADTGILVKERSIDELGQAVRTALTMDTGKNARTHVLRNFTFELREKKLTDLLNEII